LAQQKAFDGAAPGQPPPEQPRGEHPGVVEDEEIARPEVFGELCERSVLDIAGFPVQDEQPRCASLRGRLLRNQLIWKIEIEVGGIHEIDALTN
jgi:hypothetical protein